MPRSHNSSNSWHSPLVVLPKRCLKLVAPKHAGGWAYVELLRPVWWLEERNAQVGGRIDIKVPECGIDGHAKLLYIGACPPSEHDPTGRRRVITGTFHHHAAEILDLKLANLTEPIGTTLAHPFWSEDRQDFITAGNLRAGETLRIFGSTTGVTSITPRASPEAVYNLEVHLDHVYHVTGNGVLVHNAIQCDELLSLIQRPAQRLGGQLVSLIRRRAGFAEEGVPLIIDSNNMRRGMAEALRARGYNVRTVSEIFGVDPGDQAIASLAETLGGRVLANNMQDFGRTIGIRNDPRATNVNTWIRLVE